MELNTTAAINATPAPRFIPKTREDAKAAVLALIQGWGLCVEEDPRCEGQNYYAAFGYPAENQAPEAENGWAIFIECGISECEDGLNFSAQGISILEGDEVWEHLRDPAYGKDRCKWSTAAIRPDWHKAEIAPDFVESIKALYQARLAARLKRQALRKQEAALRERFHTDADGKFSAHHVEGRILAGTNAVGVRLQLTVYDPDKVDAILAILAAE